MHTQGKSATVIDGAGAATHVLLPRITATLTTTTRLFLAAKGSANFCTVGGNVDINDATVGTTWSKRAHE